jgi:hypothetical protein
LYKKYIFFYEFKQNIQKTKYPKNKISKKQNIQKTKYPKNKYPKNKISKKQNIQKTNIQKNKYPKNKYKENAQYILSLNSEKIKKIHFTYQLKTS